MKSILISIQPKWCAKIASGKKTVEVRKTCPKLDTPFKCYIYCTKSVQKNRIQKVNDTGAIYFDSDLFCPYLDDEIEVLNGKVIGEFVCDKVSTYYYGNTSFPTPSFDGDESCCECGDGYWITLEDVERACLTDEEIEKYGKGKTLYGWNISDLKIYDKPKELNEFRSPYKLDSDGFIKCGYGSCPYVKENGKYMYRCQGECPHLREKYMIKSPPQDWSYVLELNKLMVGGVEW